MRVGASKRGMCLVTHALHLRDQKGETGAGGARGGVGRGGQRRHWVGHSRSPPPGCISVGTGWGKLDGVKWGKRLEEAMGRPLTLSTSLPTEVGVPGGDVQADEVGVRAGE